MRPMLGAIVSAFVTTTLALGQGLTLSARPGLVNYVEGEAYLDGALFAPPNGTPVFLNANDTFATSKGKAEILLMPGVFLRLGERTQIAMIAPSLENLQLELVYGEAILEAVGMMRGVEVDFSIRGAHVIIDRNGLYRVTAGDIATAAAIEGSVLVTLNDQALRVGKGKLVGIVEPLRSEPFTIDENDDLYAWSSVRSQYEAAASYEAATSLANSNQYDVTGWYYDDLLDCWAWLPRGQCFSPFGWGFYSPVNVWRAPVVKCPVMRGGHWDHDHDGDRHGDHDGDGRRWVGVGAERNVPVNVKHPPLFITSVGVQRVDGDSHRGHQDENRPPVTGYSHVPPSSGSQPVSGVNHDPGGIHGDSGHGQKQWSESHGGGSTAGQSGGWGHSGGNSGTASSSSGTHGGGGSSGGGSSSGGVHAGGGGSMGGGGGAAGAGASHSSAGSSGASSSSGGGGKHQ